MDGDQPKYNDFIIIIVRIQFKLFFKQFLMA